MSTMNQYPHGYFADPVTEAPVAFQEVSLRHLAGKRLPHIWGWIFFWVKVPQYLLLEDVLFITSDGRKILVEHGFVFNGGSVPFLFWWLYPPDQPDCLPAFVVHDWECTPPYPCDSVVAHCDLFNACIANGASHTKANNIWIWVRLAGPRFKETEVIHGT